MNVRFARQLLLAMSFVTTTSFLTQSNAAAASTHSHVKSVRFSIRNDTEVEIAIRCGDQVVPIKAGATVALLLPEGSSVVAEQAFAAYSAGSVLVRVEKSLGGNTVAVH